MSKTGIVKFENGTSNISFEKLAELLKFMGYTLSDFMYLSGESRVDEVYGEKFHIIKKKEEILEKWNLQVEYFTKEIKQLKKDKRLIKKGVIIDLLRQIIYYSIPYLVGIGLGLPLSFEDIMTILLLSCFIHMLNALTPLPGDSGWTESAFILIFSVPFGKIYASSIMILWRFATYYLNILIGGCIFFIIKTKNA